jgi:hypothetical protein
MQIRSALLAATLAVAATSCASQATGGPAASDSRPSSSSAQSTQAAAALAARTLYADWKAGHRAQAGTIAVPGAVATLFRMRWNAAYAAPNQCENFGSTWLCGPAGGPYVFALRAESAGFKVTRVLNLCAITPTGYLCGKSVG